MTTNLTYLYLLSPLHTGGTTQEGNLVGIAREVHTDFPYMPSSTIRGRLRASTTQEKRTTLWGNTLDDVTQAVQENENQKRDANLIQGSLWVGDAAILWFPVPSLSHGVVWVSSPFLLQRWSRLTNPGLTIPNVGSFSGGKKRHIYLKDAIFKQDTLKDWPETEYRKFIPTGCTETQIMDNFLILSNQNCRVLVESSLWRQVKITLDDNKRVKGGFRYEEAIPPETLMYFPWSSTVAANGAKAQAILNEFKQLIQNNSLSQLGGQESLGRGCVRQWITQ
jgi:CRISPR-associated protein Cmr4